MRNEKPNPFAHACCVCGESHADSYCTTADGNFVYFHKECFKKELPKEAKEKIWRQL